jgi:hypothetical protein
MWKSMEYIMGNHAECKTCPPTADSVCREEEEEMKTEKEMEETISIA